MLSPHLLRPFSARQLGLVEGDDRVVVLAALGRHFAGGTLLVHTPTLVHRVEGLARSIEWVVFIDEPVPDAPLVARVDDMLAAVGDRDGLVQVAPFPEAVKRVEHGVVVEGIDRSTLVTVRPPEVLRRSRLAGALHRPVVEPWVNPAALVVVAGGEVGAFHPPVGVRDA